MLKGKIFINERGEILKAESEAAEALNNFFSNKVKNLNISRYSKPDSTVENWTEKTLKTTLKYKDHPCLLAIHPVWSENILNYWDWQWNHQKSYTQIQLPRTQMFLLKLSKIKWIYLLTFNVRILTMPSIFLFFSILLKISSCGTFT